MASFPTFSGSQSYVEIKSSEERFHQYSFLMENITYPGGEKSIFVIKINVFITLPVIQWEADFCPLFSPQLFPLFEERGKKK